jgi:hypothetical protein
MVSILLTVGVNPKVITATAGYQIIFIDLSSLIEALAFNGLTWLEVVWFFGISFVLDGALTVMLY